MTEKMFKQAGQMKEGNYMMIDGEPCKIRAIEKSKPGKHGAAKVRITGFGVFDDQKRTFLGPVDSDVEVPIIQRSNATVVAVMGDTVQIMDLKTYETMNAKKTADLGKLESGVEVEYMRYGDKVAILRSKASD
ncbi:MAG: translation initiation factor IF-5A [Candidatus Diapherotrites archaeon]|nr:translation initiation factor IF-5A [Candidatus Diapherotrites archaeon]